MLWFIIDFVVLPALILLPLIWVKKLVPELQATQTGCWFLLIMLIFIPKYALVLIPGVGGFFFAFGVQHKILPLLLLGVGLVALVFISIICFL
jgi:hypothetical protein